MDAYQQPYRFMRPTPPPTPSTADSQFYPHQPPTQLPPPPQLPPPNPSVPWLSSQFQYQTAPSPSPPPPQPQTAPYHSDQFHPPPPPSSYPPPHQNPLPPYPAHPSHSHYPPPRPHSNFPPPLYPSQPYHQVYQEWGNPSWAPRHQGWEYPAPSPEEDWAARARAWAAAKVALENQQPESQFTPAARPLEQSQYQDQYSQPVNPHYADVQQGPHHTSDYQISVPAAPSYRPVVVNLQGSASFSSGASSFVADGHAHYKARDGPLAAEANAALPCQENLPTSPFNHQQEVPSSYSSVTGGEDSSDQNEQLYKSSAQEGHHHIQPTLSTVGRSALMDKSNYAYGSQSAGPINDLDDQPLEFASRYNHDHGPNTHSNYMYPDPAGPVRSIDAVTTLPSAHSWAPPVAPGVVYPPVPTVPSGPQHDPLSVPSPVPGNTAPIFGGNSGPGFQPTVPPVGAPFGLGAGSALHPTAVFPGESYGVSAVSAVSERPKKASVPNWLREEIIKKKAVITSAQEHSREDQFREDEAIDKSFAKVEQADGKSIDASRSAEEVDDEDYVEAARTAAINQEIKRVLTEVLLKVTDELFDEIATKVLNEDDRTGGTIMIYESDHNIAAPDQKKSASPPALLAPKVSAKVLVPMIAKDAVTKEVNESSSSGAPGDLLGLASYASDDDGDDELESSNKSGGEKHIIHPSRGAKSSDAHEIVENGGSRAESRELKEGHSTKDDCPVRTSPVQTKTNHGFSNKPTSNVVSKDFDSSKIISRVDKVEIDMDKGLDGSNSSTKIVSREKALMQSELPGKNDEDTKATSDIRVKEARNKSDKSDRNESKQGSASKEKEVENSKNRSKEKKDENHKGQDDRHLRNRKEDDRNGSKESSKRLGVKSGENSKQSDIKKGSSHGVVEDGKEGEGKRRVSSKEHNRKEKRTKDEKDDRTRHRSSSDSSRCKRRHSSSGSSRGRNSKDNTSDRASDSSDESSDDCRRKEHSRRRNMSPSPVRLSKRQVSRSPHSKYSQRRHSPYSSHEIARRRRSRSKSPFRRHK